MKKKIYAILSTMIISSSLFSQVPNGDFEGTAFTFGGFYISTTWFGSRVELLKTNAGEGLQSVRVYTELVNDTLRPGFLFQQFDETATDFETLKINYLHKYTPGGGTDHGAVIVEVYDTLAAGPDDDVLLYQGTGEHATTVTDWTPTYLMLTSTGNTGTANSTIIYITASIQSVLSSSTVTPQDGSEIFVDAFTYSYSGVGLNDKKVTRAVVYPNPANETLYLQCNESVEKFSVLSLDGKLLSTSNSTSLDIAALSPGIYLYQAVTRNGNVVSNKFTKL